MRYATHFEVRPLRTEYRNPARSFRDEQNPEHVMGSNIAGAMIGGLAEQFSTLLGFQHLLLLAICFYLLSTWTPSLRPKLSPAE